MYHYETLALIFTIEAEGDKARQALRELESDDLDALIDALDFLAAWADAEAIRRAEKRR